LRKRGGGRYRVPPHLLALQDRYVTVAGEVAAVAIETEEDDRKIDHVWITVRAGEFGRLQISLSTCSRQNRAAGFDPRVRVGIITSVWNELPPPGVREVAPLDYAVLESAQHVEYTPQERVAVEEMLVTRARGAICVEAWGDFYVRAHIGVHQVHSRRASLAVPRDLVGRDGAVQFYFREPIVREMLLLKFAGQP
jgi:hypothetical protein